MNGVAQEGALQVHRKAQPRKALLQQAIDALKTNNSFKQIGVSLRDERPSIETLGRAAERLTELVFPGESQVQPEAIEVVAYRLRKKIAHTGAQLVTLRGLGYLLKAES